MNGRNSPIYEFDNFRLEVGERRLLRDGNPVALSSRAFDLLRVLVENNGHLISKEELYRQVWQDQIVEESNLTVQISAIRRALNESRQNPRYIGTVIGSGYRFKADVREIGNGRRDSLIIETEAPERIAIESSDEERKAQRHEKSRFLALSTAAAIATVALIFAGGYWFFNRTPKNRNDADLAKANEKQPTLKRLTNQGRVNRVELSLNGIFYAYTMREKGSFRTELRVGQTDGANDVLLRPVSDISHYPISFSADGNWLYYVEIEPISEYIRSSGAFYKIPILGGVPQKLGDSISVFAALSPDEKYIAYPVDNAENKTSSIAVAELDGSNAREIVVRSFDQSVEPESIAWSADGQFIAFGAVTGKSKNDSSSNRYEVFVGNVADRTVSQLTALEWNRVYTLEWLKDGSSLIAAARDSQQLSASSLWSIDYPNGKAQRISRDLNRYSGSLGVSADSSSMVVVQAEHASNIWIAPAENITSARQITFSTSGRHDGWRGMDFAPDGQIVHTAWVDESLTIWKMHADGTNARQLTSVGFRDERPFVTADGRFIVFQSNRSGASEIWRMDIDGNNLQQLTTSGGNSSPSVTPDGLWVVYYHAEEGDASVYRVPLDGGEEVLITDKRVLVPRVSPDGKYIAGGLSNNGKVSLAIFSIEGGEPIKQFDIPATYNFRTGAGIRWSPDGRFTSYPDEANGIWRQNLDGGEPQRMENIPAETTYSFAWSPDGKQFAYGRAREVREAVLIRDFR